jgi:hypothetical protein
MSGSLKPVLRTRIWDPVIFAPGSGFGMGKDPDP